MKNLNVLMKPYRSLSSVLFAVSILAQVGCRISEESQIEIRAAIIEDILSHREDPGSLYFLSIGSTHSDPNAGFLSMIQKTAPQIRLGSSTGKTPPYLENGTGKQGVLLWIGDIKPTGLNGATAEVEIHAGFLAAGGSIVQLQKTKGHWQVTKISTTWMS